MNSDGEIIDAEAESVAFADADEGEGTEQKPAPKTHWIDTVVKETGQPVRARFWKWAHDHGLSDDEVYEALGVEHIHDYTGTMEDAKEQILDWIEAQVESELEPAPLPEEIANA